MRRSALQRQMLAYLRSIADADGTVRFKAEEVAFSLGSYAGSVRRSMRRLEACGMLRVSTSVGRLGRTIVTLDGDAR